ncbi:hypothetical protein [Pseudoalteromonas sp. MEBiC 03485]|uniref:hypothetical protein n=1 Tax=Pseudoalteromonas sp. MEBiC 03485 TaxID=2571103 RepID=UPI0010226012|nr:hypothetical protein [Pseudoalteromonas sp. MEBiC 03485]RZD19748.1 hypothetical protein EVU92_21330 [Pseudoalteromonas sp. MEBiC 03485]
MSVFNAEVAQQVDELLGGGNIDSANELIETTLKSLTSSNKSSLSAGLFSSNLTIDSELHIEDYVFAWLVNVTLLGSFKYIESLLDENVAKWEAVEDYNWSYFANFISVDHDSNRYWVVTTHYRIGDNTGDKITLVEVDRNDIPATFDLMCEHECGRAQCTFETTQENIELLIEYEYASQLNGGSFDNECYGRPCFDVDGYTTYPKSIEEITGVEFDVLKKHLPSNTLSFNDVTESVAQAFIEHLANTDLPVKEFELLEPAF